MDREDPLSGGGEGKKAKAEEKKKKRGGGLNKSKVLAENSGITLKPKGLGYEGKELIKGTKRHIRERRQGKVGGVSGGCFGGKRGEKKKKKVLQRKKQSKNWTQEGFPTKKLRKKDDKVGWVLRGRGRERGVLVRNNFKNLGGKTQNKKN